MNRIDEIINQVTKKECVVADIGSDHAFVALKLLDKGFVKTIYNVEINEIPLQNSINNTAAYLKTGKVKNVINDGLKDWKYDKHFDYVVISGMGGNNIIHIIENMDKDIIVDHFILFPNNNADKLRHFLSSKGYYFEFEKIVFEKKYFYQLIHATKSKTKNSLIAKTKNDFYFGVHNLKNKDAVFEKMLFERLKYIKNLNAEKYNDKIKEEIKIINDYFKKTI